MPALGHLCGMAVPSLGSGGSHGCHPHLGGHPEGGQPQAAATALRSHPCIPQASERRLRPLPQKQRTLHEKILEEIRQERKLRPVEAAYRSQKGTGIPSQPRQAASNVPGTAAGPRHAGAEPCPCLQATAPCPASPMPALAAWPPAPALSSAGHQQAPCRHGHGPVSCSRRPPWLRWRR